MKVVLYQSHKPIIGSVKTFRHNFHDEMSVTERRRCHMAAQFVGGVVEDPDKPPPLYWLPKLDENLYNHILWRILVRILSLSYVYV